ncbi:aminotransferase class i and ii [Flammeovirgaceae bacterium 311]|nr:aminotransferase class i and ii [Flammeovirgaceae bacterium 311]
MISTAKRIEGVQEYYFSRKLAEVRQLNTPELPVINLGIGSPDMAPAGSAVEALVESARQEGNHGYQNYKGIPQLRQAIAAYYRNTYGVTLNPETMILPLVGSKEGIMHLTMAFVNEGEEVLVPDPGYPTYAAVANLVGATIRPYPIKEAFNWNIDLEELKQQDLSRVKLMWINFPHMPTGSTATLEQLAALVELARQHNFLLVNDNPYSLILNDKPLSILAVSGAEAVAMELNSLSKSHNMAGWRIGWLAGHQEYVDAVLRVKSNMDSGMFLGLQHAAVEALQQGEEWFRNLNQEYSRRKQVATQIMDVLGCSYSTDQAGMFLWAKAPDRIADVPGWLDEILYATHVFLTPGFIFGDAGQRYVRLSLCSPMPALEEAKARITAHLKTSSKITR